MIQNAAIQAARELFPSGLEQPEGSFRFSRDALLLADFAMECLPDCGTVADLGTGCGVVALSLLLSCPGWKAMGLEIQPELVQAARRNICRLGLEDRMSVLEGDVSDSFSLKQAREELFRRCGFSAGKTGELPLFDAVLCNPPWRLSDAGRVTPSELRRVALFGTAQTLAEFFRAADALLTRGGTFAAVCGAERLADALAALPARLHAERVRLVFTRKDVPATFVLLLARKGGRAALRVEKMDLTIA